jgi:hypothetical protein
MPMQAQQEWLFEAPLFGKCSDTHRRGCRRCAQVNNGIALDAQGSRMRGARITDAILRQIRQWMIADRVNPAF